MQYNNDFNIEKLYKKAIDKWGVNPQLNMLFEELGELIVAISKDHKFTTNLEILSEEIADSLIMIDQFIFIFKLSDLIESEKESLDSKDYKSIPLFKIYKYLGIIIMKLSQMIRCRLSATDLSRDIAKTLKLLDNFQMILNIKNQVREITLFKLNRLKERLEIK